MCIGRLVSQGNFPFIILDPKYPAAHLVIETKAGAVMKRLNDSGRSCLVCSSKAYLCYWLVISSSGSPR
jgi:hypothetical protein